MSVFDQYLEKALSKSWQMFRPPPGTFRENAPGALSSSRSSMVQKRVTVFYRSQAPEKSATQVQEALTTAQFAVNQVGLKPIPENVATICSSTRKDL